MNIEKSYMSVSGFFDLWVRLMEMETRNMEAQDSGINDSKILIISPPTDAGIKILTQANSNGESHLLCFSDALGEKAKQYSIKKKINRLEIWIEPFFSVPFEDRYFDAIFANCFFDFLPQGDFDDIVKEIKRSLKSKGLFFSVYMDMPLDALGRTWENLFSRFPSISKGVRPVDITPSLSKYGIKLKKDLTIKRLGFPMKYLMAER
ncbi:MAG: methyltransferase domain-containing protein [Calditrichaeota bacterium]|nr:methyltransferase domain-containing protein [Calditrichota bacterium]